MVAGFKPDRPRREAALLNGTKVCLPGAAARSRPAFRESVRSTV
jgi:hypothetical protein